MSLNNQTLLVTGASGHLGRRVLELLIASQAGPLIATTRTPEKLADFAAQGVDVRYADFDSPDSLKAAFAGADRLLLISTDALDEPGKRVRQHSAAIAAAEAAGVKHIVYTSLPNPEPGSPIAIAPDHYQTEQALAASSLDWTALRNNMYTDMFLGSLPRAVASGQLVAAAGDGAAAYVTREDCARAAAAALSSASTGRTTLDVTGPAAVSHAEVAALLSEISGKPVEYVAIPNEALVAGLQGAGLPPSIVDLVASFDAGVAQGSLSGVSSTVEDLTGAPAQSVREFLTANRGALVG